MFFSKENYFSITDAQNLRKQVLSEGLSTSDKLHHSFFYEIQPLIKVAEYLSPQPTKLRFCSDYEQYDGDLVYTSHNQKMEFTRAVDGHNEALQMELLKKEGWAPAFSKIEASGTKHHRIFGKNEPKATQIKCDKWYQEIADEILEAYEGKQDQKYQGLWLGITFDDWCLPSMEEKHYFNNSCKIFWRNVSEKPHVFERVFVIGVSMNYIWDSWQQ